MYRITTLLLILVLFVSNILCASLWEAYNSVGQQRRREGMQNTRFRPLLHLRGEDDYRSLGKQESLFDDEDIDENGVFIPRRSWKVANPNPLGGLHN